MRQGDHVHVRIAAACTICHFVASRKARRFLRILHTIPSTRIAMAHRDGVVNRIPNPDDPPPRLSLPEALANVFGCMLRTQLGRGQLLEPAHLAILLDFVGTPSKAARSIALATLCSLVRLLCLRVWWTISAMANRRCLLLLSCMLFVVVWCC